MARTEEQIIEQMGNPPSGLVYKPSAEWVLWRAFIARAIYLFEGILDVFKKYIETLITKKQPGTRTWYYTEARKFQNGDTLRINEQTGIMEYPQLNPEKQIIARCSVSEAVVSDVSRVVFKVAKYNNADDKVLVPLDINDELPNFSTYIENIKIAGTDTEIVNENADLIRLNAEVFFNPAYQPIEVAQRIKLALVDYRDKLDFDGVVKRHEFYATLASSEGVYAVDINTLEWKDVSHPYTSIESSQALFAGYFNYDLDFFSISLKNAKTGQQSMLITDLTV